MDCRISTSVVHWLPKPGRWVRFPLPAEKGLRGYAAFFFYATGAQRKISPFGDAPPGGEQESDTLPCSNCFS